MTLDAEDIAAIRSMIEEIVTTSKQAPLPFDMEYFQMLKAKAHRTMAKEDFQRISEYIGSHKLPESAQ